MVGASEEADALKALSCIPIGQKACFEDALKIILIKDQYHQSRFSDYYQEFWDQYQKAIDAKINNKDESHTKKPKTPQREAQFEALKNWLNLNPSNDEIQLAAHSALEILSKKDFSNLSEEEVRHTLRLLQKLVKKMAYTKSRLRKASKKRKGLDLKRTVRLNMRNGGEIKDWVFSEKKPQKLNLVLLCDVSRSMELYSRFFVHMIYAFQKAHDKIETFVFSTALHHVSPIFDNHEFEKAFSIISDRVPQWSGGTTIGNCLNQFTEGYAHGMLHRKTVVLLLSDGWDTGDPQLMADSVKMIRKKCRKLIWLNPLAGNTQFSPDTIGMKAALPYIDALLPAHNLETLKQVLQLIQHPRRLLNTY